MSDIIGHILKHACDHSRQEAVDAMRAKFDYIKFISLKTNGFHECNGVVYVMVHGMASVKPKLKEEHKKYARNPWIINERTLSFSYSTKSKRLLAVRADFSMC